MAAKEREDNLEKAMPFFDRAEQVEATDNFDYAIDMYMEGLHRAPDALAEAHIPLRRMAHIRQAKGFKQPSMVDKMKHKGGKTAVDRMLNAEYLLSKDPDNLEYIQEMVKHAVDADCPKTAEWITDILMDANNASDKPSVGAYLLLKESYKKLGLWEKSLRACSAASQMKPGDAALADELRDLSANLAVQRGRYGEEGDFRKSIKDRDKQEKLQSQEAAIKSDNYKADAVKEARQALDKEPDKAQNVHNLADALVDLETDAAYKEAVGLLDDAYREKKDFSFERHRGEILMRYYRRICSQYRAKLESDPEDDKLREKLKIASKELLKTELIHYRKSVENYPTDLQSKFEYGKRLIDAKKFDQAIPMFQDARRDPRYRVRAMDKVGVCFFQKKWYSDAAEIFSEAIKEHEMADDNLGKELRYNLARSYESDGKADQALEIYRKLARIDYEYKDVRARIDKLRDK